jgi:3-(3-hydroxy-phenyl)propionate hydroxylase
MSARTHWPVIVVGAGPTGLTVANLLAGYGVEVLLLERNPSTVQEPRAVSIDDESLRTMQSVGVINELLPNIVLGYGSEYLSPRRRRFLKVKPTTLEYGYPRRNAFRQPILESILRDHLTKDRHATVLFEAEVIGFSQFDDGVSIAVRTSGGNSYDVTSDYLICCDGSRSFARDHLGIEMKGRTFNERWLIVDIEETTDNSRDTKVYCDPTRPCLSLPGPHGTRRFEFMLHEGETSDQVLAPRFVAELLRAHGNDHTATIRRKVVYTFHARMAERWRDGRIFLAGDAAHLMPPFAGQGMNSGIRDAQNLSWKVAAVVKGSLGSALLDTYEKERRGHAGEMIELAVRMGHVMMPRTSVRAFALQTFFRLLALYPAARVYFAEMKYKPKPRFHEGFLIKSAETADNRSLVGALFPQGLVRSSNGYELLDDVLGDGFSVIAPPDVSIGLLQQTALKELGKFPVRAVAVLGKEDAGTAVESAIVVRDVRGEVAEMLSPYPPGFYLVRPDRYVAGFFPCDQAATLGVDIEKLCDSTWDDPGSTCPPRHDAAELLCP